MERRMDNYKHRDDFLFITRIRVPISITITRRPSGHYGWYPRRIFSSYARLYMYIRRYRVPVASSGYTHPSSTSDTQIVT